MDYKFENSSPNCEKYIVLAIQVLIITGSIIGIGVAGKTFINHLNHYNSVKNSELDSRNSENGLEGQF